MSNNKINSSGKIKELFGSPHIQIAIATGLSIVAMAFVSKRLLPQPIGYLPLAIPPFIAAIFEGVIGRYKNSRFCKTWYWVTAVLASTFIIIVYHIM